MRDEENAHVGAIRLRVGRGRVRPLVEPAADFPDDAFTRGAILVVAAYQLHCMHRRRCAVLGTLLEVPSALEQAAKAGARGHQKAAST